MICLRQCQAKTITDNAKSHTIYYVAQVKDLLSLKDFRNASLFHKLHRFCWTEQIGWFAETKISVLENQPTVQSY